MAEWNEADHPRDEKGRFTFGGGGEEDTSKNNKNENENENKTKDDNEKDKMQNRADVLYKSMNNTQNQPENNKVILLGNISKDVYMEPHENNYSNFLKDLATNQNRQYTVTGNSLINQVAVDNIDNPTVKRVARELFGNETAENLLMSKKDYYLNTDYAKEHKIFNNYEELNSDLKNYFKTKITEQVGADKLNSTKGIYINAQHQSSKDMAQALVHNPEFIKNVAKNRTQLNLGKSVDSSIQFTDKNFHNAVGKADIQDMHINQNGDLDFLVTDVYDFNNDKNASDLIKVGRDRQEKGEIIPYFYIYHVIIPKNKI